MGNPLALSLWFGIALYAVAGLIGIVIFHDVTPQMQTLTEGYGVAYNAIAASTVAK